MNSGSMGCTELICQVSDYDALFHLEDSSTLQVFGGSLGGIRLEPGARSKAYIHGTNLSITSFGEGSFVAVDGALANGQDAFLFFYYVPDFPSRILLEQIPEPSTVGLTCLMIVAVTLFQRRCSGKERTP
jgi:hypothetical protein